MNKILQQFGQWKPFTIVIVSSRDSVRPLLFQRIISRWWIPIFVCWLVLHIDCTCWAFHFEKHTLLPLWKPKGSEDNKKRVLDGTEHCSSRCTRSLVVLDNFFKFIVLQVLFLQRNGPYTSNQWRLSVKSVEQSFINLEVHLGENDTVPPRKLGSLDNSLKLRWTKQP